MNAIVVKSLWILPVLINDCEVLGLAVCSRSHGFDRARMLTGQDWRQYGLFCRP